MRSAVISFLAVMSLGGIAYAAKSDSPPTDETKPDATVTLKGGSVAAGIGFTWGHGTLNDKNGAHHFTIRGVSVVDVGATDYTATGHVYHLERLSDFSGNYVAAAAGATVAGGATATYLKNEHGVVIKLIATDVGLKFNLSADGVHITLKQ